MNRQKSAQKCKLVVLDYTHAITLMGKGKRAFSWAEGVEILSDRVPSVCRAGELGGSSSPLAKESDPGGFASFLFR